MKSLPRFLTALLFCAALGAGAGDAPPVSEKPTPAATSSGTAPQNLPALPVQSEHFADIHDAFGEEDDEGEITGRHIDGPAVLDVLAAVRASTEQHLKANVDTTVSNSFDGFKKLFNHAEKYRGHVVQFDGTLKYLYSKPTRAGGSADAPVLLWGGHITTSYQPLTFLTPEPLPPELKLDTPVRVTGIFVQRMAYLNDQRPGRALTWTPAVIVKRLEPITVVEEQPTSTVWFVGYLIFGMVAVALVLSRLSSHRGAVDRSNVFRRKRIEREGRDREFPKR